MNKIILLTNDDGFGVDGIHCAVEAVKDLGPVLIVVPAKNQSALSHCLTMKKPVRVQKLTGHWPWSQGVYAVHGTPADCVRLGVFCLAQKPIGLVISGTNHGANMGEDVIYSGTVAAAREGALLGIPSMAVSYNAQEIRKNNGISHIIRRCAMWMMKHELPRGVHLNINIPVTIDIEHPQFAVTELGKRRYGTRYIRKVISKNIRSYQLTEKISGILKDGTDINALHNKKVSVTPLTLAFTDKSYFKKLKKICRNF